MTHTWRRRAAERRARGVGGGGGGAEGGGGDWIDAPVLPAHYYFGKPIKPKKRPQTTTRVVQRKRDRDDYKVFALVTGVVVAEAGLYRRLQPRADVLIQ